MAKVEIPFDDFQKHKGEIPSAKLISVIDKSYREDYAENKEWIKINRVISELYKQRTDLEITIRFQKNINNGN